MRLEEVELDAPGPGEVMVRVAGVGICNTDLGVADGHVPLPLPVVLGHEGSGVVEQVADDVASLQPGDHVVLSFDHCGGCPTCRSGRPAYCDHFVAMNSTGCRMDGSVTMRQGGDPVYGSFLGQSSFATYSLASARNAIRVPDDLPIELLGPLGCSLQTGAGAVLRVLQPKPDSSLAVFGAGPVGMAAVMAARAAGCATVVVVDPDVSRRELALELGATVALEPAEQIAQEVRRIVPGGVDHSVETVGTAQVVDAALAVLASPGSCATLGFRGPRNRIEIDQGHLLLGRSITGVIEGDVDPQTFIADLLALHRTGLFPFERLITTFPFAEIDAAVGAARSGSVLKPVLVMN
ncbi:MAG: NAD(P)-dependent alcohol dehydrogenase [Solirubrobacteraceae bacterium]|nr:NAD(P)-dependent alcohol dehydrogenase [Solirubrobacteraceae bacterium]